MDRVRCIVQPSCRALQRRLRRGRGMGLSAAPRQRVKSKGGRGRPASDGFVFKNYWQVTLTPS
jgi:hypothetical protein